MKMRPIKVRKTFIIFSLILGFNSLDISPCLAQTSPITELRKAAEQGDAKAQTTLGFIYAR
jgi:TPR repeat protein